MRYKFIFSSFAIVVLSLLSLTLSASESVTEVAKLVVTKTSSLKGNFVQGGLVIGKTSPANKVVFAQQNILVSAEGDFILGFNRDEKSSIKLSVTNPKGIKETTKLTIKKRDYNIQRINGLAKSKVSPRKPEVLARIRKESAQAGQARKRNDERDGYLETFIWPTTGSISGVYGSQRVLNGKARRPHFGVDIAAPTGTNVLAPASGIITLAHKNMFFSGGTIILDHGHGLSSTFLHLSKLLVEKGDVVQQGDLIAQVGATGRVTGAHLDWRMNLFKRRVDPQLLVPSMDNFINTDKKH